MQSNISFGLNIQMSLIWKETQTDVLSQNSAIYATKCCMVDAVLQFWAMTDGNATLREVKNWHGTKKQPRMSRLLQRQNVSRCLKAGWLYVIWNLHQDPGSLTETKIFHYWEIYRITDELCEQYPPCEPLQWGC